MKKLDFEIFFISGLLVLVGFIIGMLTHNLIKNKKEHSEVVRELQKNIEYHKHVIEPNKNKGETKNFNERSKTFQYSKIHLAKIS